jgi:acyl-CoA thioester hydrolase
MSRQPQHAEAVPTFRCSIRIPVRFGDMDALGHVNNAKYLTYFEEARMKYWTSLFPLDANNVASLGIILAEATVRFRSPAHAGDLLEVFVRVSHLGTKSFVMEYRIENAATRALVADGSTVQVMYDYAKERTTPMPDDVRKKIMEFEELPAHSNTATTA